MPRSWRSARTSRCSSASAAGERRDPRDRHAARRVRRRPAERQRLVLALRMGGAQREQPDPGGEPVARVHARVRDGPQHVAAHARDRAAQRAAVGQRHLHVDRARLAPGQMGDDLVDDRMHRVDHRLAEHPGRQRAAGDLRERRGARRRAGEARVEQPLADAPGPEPVELDRQRVLDLVGVVADGDAEPPAQERAHRALDEAHQVVELEHRRGQRGQRRGEERARDGPLARQRVRAAEHDAIEAPDAVGDEPAVREVALVERLQRMAYDDVVARAGSACARSRRAARPPAPRAGAGGSCARRCRCR